MPASHVLPQVTCCRHTAGVLLRGGAGRGLKQTCCNVSTSRVEESVCGTLCGRWSGWWRRSRRACTRPASGLRRSMHAAPPAQYPTLPPPPPAQYPSLPAHPPVPGRAVTADARSGLACQAAAACGARRRAGLRGSGCLDESREPLSALSFGGTQSSRRKPLSRTSAIHRNQEATESDRERPGLATESDRVCRARATGSVAGQMRRLPEEQGALSVYLPRANQDQGPRRRSKKQAVLNQGSPLDAWSALQRTTSTRQERC